MTLITTGELNPQQVAQLLQPIHPARVMQVQGHSHLSQQDVKAHLIRVFGFGHFDIEVLQTELVFETHEQKTSKAGKDYTAFDVCYRALVRLTIRNSEQQVVATYEDGSMGTAQNQPSRGDAHDLAYKSAISLSVKRAATALGDQFGLSLYNKGQMSALVRGTLVGTAVEGDVQDGVEQQVEDGIADTPQLAAAESAAAEPVTVGQQGTKRASAASEAPVAAVSAPVDDSAPSPWVVRLNEASTEAEVKAVWDEATAANEMTTELKMLVISHKSRVEALGAEPVAEVQG